MTNQQDHSGSSTRAVWRFEATADAGGMFWLTTWPKGAKPVHVELVPTGGVQVWAEVPDTDAPQGAKLFELYGTGQPVDENAEYVGTFPQRHPAGPNHGRFIWHLYHYPAQGGDRVE